ncbi:MAG TPA: choline-sulfatase [Steroidobacteraceae bacterium]|nr:choline-sulfatase [Steroidobacteraceae bacterium]
MRLMAAQSRPNLLILMADQLTAGVLRAYGGRVARTPHIDRLAAEGVLFESFYCNSPLCAPSRFSFLAGQLPSKIGAYDNAVELPAMVPTFAHYLRSAGYYTALAGKMHFCGPDQLHGFEDRLTTDIYPADFGWTPDWTRFEERPGWYHTMDSVTQAGSCVRTNQIDFDDEVTFAARQKLFDLARSRDRRPFCVVASLTHPHDPYVIPETYWDRYRDDEIDLPRVADLAGREDPHSTRLRHVIGLDLAHPTQAQVRAARHAYYGAVSYVDDQIGTLLETLREARFADNTIILLLADHGDMLGERGLWYKMNFFEPACRIPLIVHAPGRFAPRRVPESASLLDILPTLAEIAHGGCAPEYAAPLGGRSLLPALQGGSGPGEVLGEYLAEGAIAPIVMIRRGRHKFVHCPADPDQLYDVAADRDERANLAASPGEAGRVAAFRAEIAQRWPLDEIHEAVLASQKQRHFVYPALRRGRFQPWDHQPVRDATRLYIRNDQELNDLEAMARFPRLD